MQARCLYLACILTYIKLFYGKIREEMSLRQAYYISGHTSGTMTIIITTAIALKGRHHLR